MKNQRLSRFSRTFPALTASLIFSCCATLNNAWSLEIRVGVVTDQSGLNGDLSRDYLAGARTFFDHTNAVGGINGRKIAVITKDDEGRAANTISLTRELIEKDKVDILFGYMGDEGLVALSKDPTFNGYQSYT